MTRRRLVALALLSLACTSPDGPRPITIVTFGDSNTDVGFAATSSVQVAHSYVSNLLPRPGVAEPNHATQLAGKIERLWATRHPGAHLIAVNHGISGSTTGGGAYGGPDRHPLGSPNPRTVVGGITRFDAEALGAGYPWSGGESGSNYPTGAVIRLRAMRPGPDGFAYVSLGTNDGRALITPARTIANLDWMIGRWLASGARADHFILTTLPPRTDPPGGDSIPLLNDGIRTLASARGVHLLDLAAYVSDDNGSTWRNGALHVGDGVHYAESVRDWLAQSVVSYVEARTP